MFLVPFVLGMQFGNHWRYLCYLLVQWLLLVRWFVGSSVAACCCLAQVCEFEVPGLQLGMFVLAHWFVTCCFLLFTSALQGWGPAPVVGAGFFFHFTVFRSCTCKWTCGFVIYCIWQSQDLAPVPCPPILLLNFAPIIFPSSGPYLHVFAKCSCRRK
jgi:hypothetical protein